MFQNVMKIWFSMRCICEFDAIYLQWWDVTFTWCVESIYEVVQMLSLPYRICVSSYVYGIYSRCWQILDGHRTDVGVAS